MSHGPQASPSQKAVRRGKELGSFSSLTFIGEWSSEFKPALAANPCYNKLEPALSKLYYRIISKFVWSNHVCWQVAKWEGVPVLKHSAWLKQKVWQVGTIKGETVFLWDIWKFRSQTYSEVLWRYTPQNFQWFLSFLLARRADAADLSWSGPCRCKWKVIWW